MRWVIGISLAVLGVGVVASPAAAALPLSAGAYRADVWTDPAVIPTGNARIFIALRDEESGPVAGAKVRVLAKMPDMDMGEQEEAASPEAGRPGVYSAPARFAMEGGYEVTVSISAAAGEATARLTVRTGQDTGGATTGRQAGGFDTLWTALPWIILVAGVAFVLFRLRRIGARISWKDLFHPSLLVAMILIVAAFAISGWAVRAWKRPGSMSLVDALASDMSKMPAPPGEAPVALATVDEAPVEASVRYTGSAVGYVEQDVYPRVTGWITWMPLYAGDTVRKDQLLAKLDTREAQSRVQERAANRTMAEQMASIAGFEYRQALAAAAQAKAEVRGREGAVEESRRMEARTRAMLQETLAGVSEARGELLGMRADLTAARHERAAMDSMLQSAREGLPEAAAMLSAMKADQAYWRLQLPRLRALLEKGAISGEEFQREEAVAKGVDAKVRQAEARLSAVRSDIRAAESRLARAEAMVDGAQAKISQTQARVEGMEAKVEQARSEIAAAAGRIRMVEGELEAAQENARAMQAMAEAGAGKIRQSQAGVRSAQAALTTAGIVRGYSEIRSLVDGVVTQRLISPGVLVSPGQAILRVAQIQPIRLQANVAESDLARIRLGARVLIRTQDGVGGPLEARISSIAPAMDPATRTGTVEALFPNLPRRFLPGQYLRMEIRIPSGAGTRGGALRVPAAAIRWQSAPSSSILSGNQTAFVWLAEPDGSTGRYTVQRVDVRVGTSDGDHTEVLAGLKAGQRVVIRGHDSLRPGDSVTAVPWGQGGPGVLPGARRATGAQPSGTDGRHEHSGHGKATN